MNDETKEKIYRSIVIDKNTCQVIVDVGHHDFVRYKKPVGNLTKDTMVHYASSIYADVCHSGRQAYFLVNIAGRCDVFANVREFQKACAHCA